MRVQVPAAGLQYMTRILYEAAVVLNFNGSGYLFAHINKMKVDEALTKFTWSETLSPVHSDSK